MTKPHLALVAPTTDNGTVADRRRPPPRRRNAEVRAREYLTDGEIARLITAAARNRYGHRDATMVLVAYRHGLRSAELVTLLWDAVDFAHGRVHVYRVKSGSESVHPLACRGLRALRRLQRGADPATAFIFTSERGASFTPAGPRAAGPAPAQTRAGSGIAVYLHVGARCVVHAGRLSQDVRAAGRRGWLRLPRAPAHAEARMRLQ